MSRPLRRLVSGAQSRFVQDGVDMDMVYITDRLIIMAYPAEGVSTIWRNNRKAVRRFLDERHGTAWRVWNLRPKSENGYDGADFHGRVSRYPFPDHHPPPLSLIHMAVADMTAWLAEDASNVVVIHCKAGKGRSGTIACSYLISLPKLPSPPQDPRNVSNAQKRNQKPSKASHSSFTSSHHSDVSPSQRAQSSKGKMPSLPCTTSSRQDKVEAVFTLHSSQRMKSKETASGALLVSMNTVSRPYQYEPGSSHHLADDHPHASQERLSAASSLSRSDQDSTSSRKGLQRGRLLALGLSSQGSAANDAIPCAEEEPGPSTLSSKAALDPDPGQGEAKQSIHGSGPVGVSIASQRRWVGYWARVLAQQDARQLFNALTPSHESRAIRLLRISVLQDIKWSSEVGAAASEYEETGGVRTAIRSVSRLNTFKVFIGKYEDTFVSQLEDFELKAQKRARASDSSNPAPHPPDLPSDPPKRKLNEAPNGVQFEENVKRWDVDVVSEAEKARHFPWPDNGRDADGHRFEFFDWFAKLKDSEKAVATGKTGEGHGKSIALWHHFHLDPTCSHGSSKLNLASVSKKQGSAGPPTDRQTPPLSSHQGLLICPDREVCLRVQSRNTALNVLLPEIASSAGWTWFIPAFEEPRSPSKISKGDKTTLRFGRKEVDFAKKITGLMGVEVEWEWVATGNERGGGRSCGEGGRDGPASGG